MFTCTLARKFMHKRIYFHIGTIIIYVSAYPCIILAVFVGVRVPSVENRGLNGNSLSIISHFSPFLLSLSTCKYKLNKLRCTNTTKATQNKPCTGCGRYDARVVTTSPGGLWKDRPHNPQDKCYRRITAHIIAGNFWFRLASIPYYS